MAITLNGSASDIRTQLGLGTAATLDVGTGANNVLQLDGSGALPAVSGTALTGVTQDKTVTNNNENQTHTSAQIINTTSDTVISTITVTPASTGSRFLLIYSSGHMVSSGGGTLYSKFTRNGSNLGDPTRMEAGAANRRPVCQMILDAPSTTSSVTYRYVLYAQSGYTGYWLYGGSNMNFQVIEIAANS